MKTINRKNKIPGKKVRKTKEWNQTNYGILLNQI